MRGTNRAFLRAVHLNVDLAAQLLNVAMKPHIFAYVALSGSTVLCGGIPSSVGEANFGSPSTPIIAVALEKSVAEKLSFLISRSDNVNVTDWSIQPADKAAQVGSHAGTLKSQGKIQTAIIHVRDRQWILSFASIMKDAVPVEHPSMFWAAPPIEFRSGGKITLTLYRHGNRIAWADAGVDSGECWISEIHDNEITALLRKMNAPNQLPDPTSPSVTPPAGAGGAPSVGADH